MSITKKENKVEQIKSERSGLDHLGVFIGNALGSFRGRFLFRRGFQRIMEMPENTFANTRRKKR